MAIKTNHQEYVCVSVFMCVHVLYICSVHLYMHTCILYVVKFL